MTDTAPAKGKGLQIVFRMLTEGRAAIRVLDLRGTEVRRLFDGTMKTGSWSVDWDGHLADGKPAQPGLYRIEVRTNGVVKTREVHIR
jgi:flagellar hook assembly protein FlgD